jgi:zinc protease
MNRPCCSTAKSLSWVSDLIDVQLSNGLRVLFAQRQKSPVVELRFVFDGGFATDPHNLSGLAGIAMAMFSDGALRAASEQLAVAQGTLGAIIHGWVNADAAVIGMSALTANFDDALGLYAELISHPEFRPEDLELVRTNRLALIARERLNSTELALRVLPSMLYGAGHVYARPLSGSGTEEGIAAITGDDLHGFYGEHLVPQGGTLVVAGSCEPAQLLAFLERHFGRWRPAPYLACSPQSPMASRTPPTVMVIDRPGAMQAAVAAGLLTMPRNSSRAEALMVADTILGGFFSSRLNLNLRESKGWTYGVRSSLVDARLRGGWLIRTTVRHDTAAAAMGEIASEMATLAGEQPCSPEEFARAVDYLVARIPCMHETCAEMADALAHAVIYGLPPAYHQDLPACLRRLTPDDITETCRQILAAGTPRWMVVGHAGEMLNQLRDSAFGKIEITELNPANG